MRDLRTKPAHAEQREGPQVPAGMVLDRMPAGRNLPTEIGVSRGEVRNAEKGRTNSARIEQVEDLRGSLGIRAVVEGQRDFPAPCRRFGQSGEIRAEDRAARTHSRDAEQQVIRRDRAECPRPRFGYDDDTERCHDMQTDRADDRRLRSPPRAGRGSIEVDSYWRADLLMHRNSIQSARQAAQSWPPSTSCTRPAASACAICRCPDAKRSFDAK